MTPSERYFWDLTGYLVVKGVLSRQEVAEANAIVDRNADKIVVGESTARGSIAWAGTGRPTIHGMLEWTRPDSLPFRKMLAHPAVVSRLNVMCGKGFRLDHGPMLIHSYKGTAGHTLHGAGEPFRDHVAYTHQNGVTYTGGVTVSWQLNDCRKDQGGFACIPGSHKSRYPMPRADRTGDGHLGVSMQPEVEAGDVLFFMDSAQSHGAFPWKLESPRRSILFKFASRTAVRGGVAQGLAVPETFWDGEIVKDMTPEQRAVMFGPYSNHRGEIPFLAVEPDGTVHTEERQVSVAAD